MNAFGLPLFLKTKKKVLVDFILEKETALTTEGDFC